MGSKDPKVDAYIAKSAEFAKPILNRLRGIVHAACPDAMETLKWHFPFFEHDGRILCSMAAFKAHCAFRFWQSPRAADRKGSTQPEGSSRLLRIESVADLPSRTALIRMVKEAMKGSVR
jgi:hypothetical protein